MSTTALALGLTFSFYDKLSGPLQAAQDQLRGTSHAAREPQEKLARVAELSAQIATTDKPNQKMQFQSAPGG